MEIDFAKLVFECVTSYEKCDDGERQDGFVVLRRLIHMYLLYVIEKK